METSFEECPYCGAELDLNHDDGYGYEEGYIYEQECENCQQAFCYSTEISYNHTTWQAPCKNGEEHKWEPIKGVPKAYYAYRERCEYCEEERITDKEAHEKAIKEYFMWLREGKNE